nr:MAG TPA: hypothetical protein [Caudoviricetes sp.]
MKFTTEQLEMIRQAAALRGRLRENGVSGRLKH